MLGRAKQRDRDQDGSASQPLLSRSEDISPRHSDEVLFSVEDEDDLDESSALSIPDSPESRPGHVRFQEDVQVIGPPLRSTFESREAEFELDTDDLDNETVAQLESTPQSRSSRSRRLRDQSTPLLVGLLDSASARRSSDGALQLQRRDGSAEEEDEEDVDLEALAAKRLEGGGMLDSVANMANSILGAGIIGLPYAMRQAGFVSGIILLVILCGVTDWTIRLIVVNAKLSGRNSYIEIMHHCFGPSGRAAVSFFQFAFAFGGMCAFGIIIGDTIPHVIRLLFPKLETIPVLSLLTKRQFVIALCTICISYPLSLYRSIDKLARASILALLGMLIIVASVLAEGPRVPAELKGDPSARFTVIEPGVFRAIGVISFAFVCHHNSLLIYGSLRTPTLDRFAKVTHLSTALSLVACCTLAISAYLVFTDKTQGNILNNFAGDDTVINVARFCFGLNMFTTLPLELFVCREVIEQYFFSHEPFNMQRHVFFTSVILCSSMIIALITCDLGVMLEITGGASATALAFIFPAACYLRLADLGPAWYSRGKLPAIACVVFGVVIMAISLFSALQKVWTPEGNARICA
ncbi:amino acid transporter [Laetiporus sulphureus 93-53]|uniref:Amino acid transporter n=1 Tax=Laetiporus sulphureus 93-53 TaxID=1314785 RepID=A0A165F3M9_9APHY|nr:amino acid transporter [Laetiporus sulphureus 93-53]KZT08313.1 amino acid transporter [Laetiporus sulphureus 93-53]